MKKTIISILILIVISLGFYYGYQKAMSSNPSSRFQANKVLSKPTAMNFNAGTKEFSWIANFNTPIVVFDEGSTYQKLTATVQPVPNDTNSENKITYLVNLQLTTAHLSGVVNAKIKVLENQSFSIQMGSNQSNYLFEGKVNPSENNQVKVTLKTNNY